MAAGISTRNRATMEKSSLSLKLKTYAGQRVTLFERLDWKTPCLMHTLANHLRSSQKYTWAFYASVDGLSLGTIKSRRYSFLKSAWRDHTLDVLYKLSQNRHNYYCVCVFPSHSFWTSSSLDVPAGHTGGRPHRISRPPSFCGAYLDFSREKNSAIPFPSATVKSNFVY